SVGPQTLTWDGTLSGGPRAPDGVYVLALTIADDAVTFTRSVAITLDRTPPVLKALSYRNLRFHVSDPSTLGLPFGPPSYPRVRDAQRGRRLHCFRRELAGRLVHVHADSEDHLAVTRLGQHTDELAARHDHVVRMAKRRVDARLGTERRCHRVACDERELRPQ